MELSAYKHFTFTFTCSILESTLNLSLMCVGAEAVTIIDIKCV